MDAQRISLKCKSVRLQMMKNEDKERVENFMLAYYIRDIELFQKVFENCGTTEELDSEYKHVANISVELAIKSEPMSSVIAIDETNGDIAGICLNMISNNDFEAEYEYMYETFTSLNIELNDFRILF